MTPAQRAAMRALAKAATPVWTRRPLESRVSTSDIADARHAYIAACSPEVIEGLLDDLDAAERERDGEHRLVVRFSYLSACVWSLLSNLLEAIDALPDKPSPEGISGKDFYHAFAYAVVFKQQPTGRDLLPKAMETYATLEAREKRLRGALVSILEGYENIARGSAGLAYSMEPDERRRARPCKADKRIEQARAALAEPDAQGVTR